MPTGASHAEVCTVKCNFTAVLPGLLHVHRVHLRLTGGKKAGSEGGEGTCGSVWVLV